MKRTFKIRAKDKTDEAVVTIRYSAKCNLDFDADQAKSAFRRLVHDIHAAILEHYNAMDVGNSR